MPFQTLQKVNTIMPGEIPLPVDFLLVSLFTIGNCVVSLANLAQKDNYVRSAPYLCAESTTQHSHSQVRAFVDRLKFHSEGGSNQG